jgi:hypothetical protein
MPKMSPVNLARYNKLYVAAVTFAGALVSNQVITGRTADIVSAAIGAAGVLGVFAVPNYSPAVSHVPMPLAQEAAPKHDVEVGPPGNYNTLNMPPAVAAHFGKPGLGAAGPHRDPLTGRYSKEP